MTRWILARALNRDSNPANSSFCGSCGKAILAPSTGPRIVDPSRPLSEAGTSLQIEALEKAIKSASTTLMVIGILMTIGGGIYLLFGQAMVNDGESTSEEIGIVVIFLFSIAAIYFGLFAWSKKNPLVAAIVGLVVYCTLILLSALGDPASLYSGLIIKIIIIVFLVRGINAGEDALSRCIECMEERGFQVDRKTVAQNQELRLTKGKNRADLLTPLHRTKQIVLIKFDRGMVNVAASILARGKATHLQENIVLHNVNVIENLLSHDKPFDKNAAFDEFEKLEATGASLSKRKTTKISVGCIGLPLTILIVLWVIAWLNA